MFSVVFLIALVLSASVATEHGVATLSSGVHPDTLYRGASTSTIAGAADHVGAGNDTTIFETFRGGTMLSLLLCMRTIFLS